MILFLLYQHATYIKEEEGEKWDNNMWFINKNWSKTCTYISLGQHSNNVIVAIWRGIWGCDMTAHLALYTVNNNGRFG